MDGNVFTVDFPERKEQFRIANRVIGPAADGEEPLQGSDVAMLEQMLWQLGVSPGGGPGVAGRRIPNESQREIFEVGNGTVGKMLGRFNYFSHTPVTRTTDHQAMVSLIHNGRAYNTIDELQKHWLHYLEAYGIFSDIQRYNFSDLSQADKDAAEAVFDGVIHYPRGVELDDIEPTYTVALHQQVSRYRNFQRVDILRAMAEQESNGRHWGYSARLDDVFRLTVGGADEAGSTGFNQIQNKYAYGGLSLDGTSAAASRGRICGAVSAYDQDGVSRVNHYDPGQNLVAKAVWLAAAEGNCGRSFRSAFNNDSYTGTYRSGDTLVLLSYSTGEVAEAVAGGNHTDDTYELLAKAIGAYNQGAGIFNQTSWLELITSQMTPGSNEYQEIMAIPYRERSPRQQRLFGRTTAMRYGIRVMHDNDKLNLPYRTYKWRGGVYPDRNSDGTPNPRAGQFWCFEYGERDWMNPAFNINLRGGGVRPARWNDYFVRASGSDEHKVEC
ncbi:hypothetical protein CHH28_16420 [Bacterioplanes sanyensis]|uniref:Uncharacterized protein n=2 Tax=Bacterioplanes sanyensis TaxID=1249553 RepID=A0A222FNA3_9GAMM|nr:hypothetical protein CHH28_16420 [Bacterioplanes sanyensis]